MQDKRKIPAPDCNDPNCWICLFVERLVYGDDKKQEIEQEIESRGLLWFAFILMALSAWLLVSHCLSL